MDFEHSERATQVMAQAERFVRERVVPNEQTYLEQLVGTDEWREWKIPPILEDLKAEAKGLGANAVIEVRFSTSMVMQAAAELLAYGTAVVVEEAADS